MTKVAVVISHPVQHFCPQYESWSECEQWETKVFFGSKAGLENYDDKDFKKEIEWNLSLDFPHKFLNNGKVLDPSAKLDAPKLKEGLETYEPDVLITYGYRKKINRRAIYWASQMEGVKLFMVSDSENNQKRAWYKHATKKVVLGMYLYPKIDGFLTLGNANEEYHYEYGADIKQCVRLPLGIDRERFELVYQEKPKFNAEIRNKFNISNDENLCIVVGKLVPWKRQRDLVSALSHLSDEEPGTTALILGSGETIDEVRAEAEALDVNRAIVPGFVHPSELPKYYAAADIYVHTSEQEPHSVAITEATYMGCPVILSDHCGSYGPTDDVQPGRNGFVYSCGDTQELASQIQRLASNSDLREQFSEASRSIAVRAQNKAHGEGLKEALLHFGVL